MAGLGPPADGPLTWTTLHALMNRTLERPDGWIPTGHWALDTLETMLGSEWPSVVQAKAPDGGAPALAYASTHTVAYAELLELAVRLTLVDGLRGHAKLRAALASDPRPDVLAHSRIQLEVATLALRAGQDPELEPSIGNRRPADVSFDLVADRVVVETRVVLTSDPWRHASRQTDEVFERISGLERSLEVRVEGDMSRHLDASEVDELERRIEQHAALVAIGAAAPPIRLGGAHLRVVHREHTPVNGLTGPQMTGESWARVGSRIRQKAEVAQESGANWLRLDALNGLWQFTHWAGTALPAKLAALTAIARPALGALDGLVISSGLLLNQGDLQDEDSFVPEGGAILRRRVAPLRVRETLVIPSVALPLKTGEFWRTAYAEEPSWLAWALERLALPSPREIFG
ncbi:MAG: hypothetical protein JWR63_3078 [Conexibacter sp.]|nr:hypothetical protein [Conexibacter sp.]